MPPFYAMETVLIPFQPENGALNVPGFMLNGVLSFFFIHELVRCVEEQFHLQAYVFTRTSKGRAMLGGLAFINKEMAVTLLFKIIADFVFGGMDGFVHISRFLWLEFSTLLTLSLWISTAYFMRIKHVPVRVIRLSMTVIALLLVYAASLAPALNVVVFASPSFLSNPPLYCAIKVLLILVMGVVLLQVIKKYEVIHGRAK